MNQAKLIEYEKGLFYSMVQQTGERERMYINHMLTCQIESTRLWKKLIKVVAEVSVMIIAAVSIPMSWKSNPLLIKHWKY